MLEVLLLLISVGLQSGPAAQDQPGVLKDAGGSAGANREADAEALAQDSAEAPVFLVPLPDADDPGAATSAQESGTDTQDVAVAQSGDLSPTPDAPAPAPLFLAPEPEPEPEPEPSAAPTPNSAPPPAANTEAVAQASPQGEPQVATGRFTTALEVKPILNATQTAWIAVREYGGQDLLYVTHLWAWRCGLIEMKIGINGNPPEIWPMPDCHLDQPSPGALLDGDGVPYRAFGLNSVHLIEVVLTYDDLTTQSQKFTRQGMPIP